MKDLERRRRGLIFNTLTILVILGSVSFLIWSLRTLILPVTLGILFAYLFRPLKNAFKYRWIPNGIRLTLLFAFLTGSILLGTRFVKENIPNEKEKLEILVRTKYKLNEKFNKIMEIDPKTGKGNAFYNLIAQDINPIRKGLNEYLELSPEQIEAFRNFHRGVDGFTPVPERYYEYFLANSKQALNVPLKSEVTSDKMAQPRHDSSFLFMAMDIFSTWVVLPIIFIFFLLDDGVMTQFFIRLVPNRYFELTLTLKEEVDSAIGKYLRGLSMDCVLVGIALAIGLFLSGIPLKMSLLIGILSGLATAIPLLGPIVGLVFSLAYTLIAEDIHPLLPYMTVDNVMMAVVVVNILVAGLDNFVFQPIVLGGAVDLHPLVIILGVMAGSTLCGMAGVLLAIPAIVILKVVTEHTFRGLKDYRII